MLDGQACRRAALLLMAVAACGETGNDNEGTAGAGGDAGGGGGTGGVIEKPNLLFGAGDTAQLTVIADENDGLNVPRDLGFNPAHEGELWIVSRANDSVTLVFDATTAAEQTEKRTDDFALHFMEEVSSVAFGAPTFMDDSTFGTCQESNNTYNHQQHGNNFMGPALWSANLDIFAVENPIGLGSHLDMLHHSPFCMGIAHDKENVYWVFDGYHGQIARYDFKEDHGAGYDDHSDGYMVFFEEPQVLRVVDVPSHMFLDQESDFLYIADTGNRRVLRFDTSSGRKSGDIAPIEPGTVVEEWSEATWDELVPAAAGLLDKPSGIALHGEVLYVGDNGTGEILAFDLEGELLGTLSTGLAPGALMGIEVGPDERLYLVDAVGHRVLRVEG